MSSTKTPFYNTGCTTSPLSSYTRNQHNSSVGKYFAIFLCSSLFLVGILGVSLFSKEDKSPIEALITIGPFLALVIVVIQLARKLVLERVAFIENYISKFFMDQSLNKAFHDLIYTYDDDTFKQIDCIRIKQELDKEQKPVFPPFSDYQRGREIGSRFYHPKLFQGSPEEMRLDAVLGYFNVIAYRYKKGLLLLDDISGNIGYCLLVMRSRMVIDEYIKLHTETWEPSGYNKKYGRNPPFEHLKKLMDDIYEHQK